ncbi:MAG TPA: LamB/YcsF family protein [Candidatus Acidoferrum sp.]|nr:LamB/YcsF family protein [Candidatus Acidoferrum sp.]
MALAINCDMGEGFGLYRCGDDAGIMPYITLANVACGFHASDPTVMHKTVRLAKQHSVKVGAHPSLPDLQGFGRREMRMDPKELTDCLIYQVAALKGFLDAEGMALNHIKPHGALYGMAARSEDIANAICDAADVFKVPLLGMARTKHEEIYTKRGFKFVPEFYVDLDYDKDGKLIITREHVGWDPDVAAKRTLRAITEKKVKTVDGNDIPMTADCICVHSDTPGAVAVAKAVKEAIKPYLN